MKRRIVKYLPAIIIFALSFILTTASVIVAKNIEQPMAINSLDDLENIHNNLSGYYVLSCDIDMMEKQDGKEEYRGWKPLGTKENPFTGRIDFNYHSLINLFFSDEYLSEQFVNSEDVLVGFLGYSTGTIIHANFYKPVLPDFSTYSSNGKNIVYGTACAINGGYVTTCSMSVVGNTSVIKGNNITFGSLVGINNKQVLLAKVINTIVANVGGDSILGGIIGVSGISSTNSYLFRGGYNSFTCNGYGTFSFGGIIGMIDGAEVNNVYFGSPDKKGEKQSMIIGAENGLPSKLFAGGAVGRSLSSSSKNKLINICVNNECSVNSIINNCEVGGLIGGGEPQSTTVSSCVFGGNISCANTNNSGIFSQSHVIKESVNSYYLKVCLFPGGCNLEYASKIDYSELSLKSLNWPTNTERGYWTKESDYFYLNI